MYLLLSPPRSIHTHSTPSQLQVFFLKIAHCFLFVLPIYTGHGANHWIMVNVPEATLLKRLILPPSEAINCQ